MEQVRLDQLLDPDSIATRQLKDKLMARDWDFKSTDTKRVTHGIHVYPARMVPEMVEILLKQFSKVDDLVLDPFCGSGTVLLESLLNRRRSIGIDVNPLATKLSRAKTTLVDLEVLTASFESISSSYHQRQWDDQTIRKQISETYEKRANLDHWFKPYVQQEIFKLKILIDEVEQDDIKNLLEIGLSDTIRQVSNNRNSSYKLYRMAKEDLKNHQPQVFETFSHKIEQIKQSMEALQKRYDQDYLPTIINSNLLMYDLEEEIDLILTSPPYGDSATTVGYGQFSKYSLVWLGHQRGIGTQVDNRGLGGAKKEFEEIHSELFYDIKEQIRQKELQMTNKRHQDFHLFFQDYQRALAKMFPRLKSGRFAIFVVGNRSMREIRVPMDLITVEIGAHYGMRKWALLHREIPMKRHPSTQKLYADPKWDNLKSLGLSPYEIDNIGKETIVILQKE